MVPESNQKPHLAKVKENDWRGFVRVKNESVQTSNLVLEALKAEEEIKSIPTTNLNKKKYTAAPVKAAAAHYFTSI